jgi:hypothetical protein
MTLLSGLAMHIAFEKGGLVIENQPIPWNADAVVVECLARLPAPAVRRQDEFYLRIPGRDPIAIDRLRRDDVAGNHRLFFRFPPPPESTSAELLWRRQRLGEQKLNILTREEFLASLALQLQAVAVRLEEQTVACQAFVASQCKSVIATGLLSSPTVLAPLMDMDLHVVFQWEETGKSKKVPVHFSSSQLRGKQAIATVAAPRLMRCAGNLTVSGELADRTLACQRLKSLTKAEFLESLRISASRFVVQSADGKVHLAREMPPPGQVAGVGPCFLISSSHVGAAGHCPMTVRLQMDHGKPPIAMPEQIHLVTDGPTPFVPGTLPMRELDGAIGFELFAGNRSLGCLPLTGMPVATFDAEGGFRNTGSYLWNEAAEDQLRDKLAALMAGRSTGLASHGSTGQAQR